MHDLQLVGFTTDRRGLIFRTQAGARVESYVVPITDELVRLVSQLAESAHDDGPPAVPDEVVEPVVAVAEPRAESQLSVRDIQARLRAGEPIARVAAEAGVSDDWIERFAPPIRAEQRRVVERAQQSHLQRSRSGTSAVPLRRAVGMAMADKGIAFTVAAFEAAWSARLLGHDRWAVEFTYRHRGQDRTAIWDFDATSDSLTTNDRAASQIGFVGADRTPDDDTGIEVDGIVGAPDAKTQIGTATERGRRGVDKTVAPATKEAKTGAARAKAAAPKPSTAKTSKTTKTASETQAAPATQRATEKAPARKQASQKAPSKKRATTKPSATKRTATKTITSATKTVTRRKPGATRAAPTKQRPPKTEAAAKRSAGTRAAKKPPTERPPSTGATPATRRATGSANALIAKTARKQVPTPTSEAPPAAVRSAAASKRTVADTKRPIDEVVAPQPTPERTGPPTSNGARTPPPAATPSAAVPASLTPTSTPEPQSPEALDRLRAQRVAARLAEEGAGATRPPEAPPTSSTPSAAPADADRTAARRARAAERSAPTVQFRSGSAAPVRVVDATEPASTPVPRPTDPAPTGGPNGRPSVPGTRADEPGHAAPDADANGAARPRTRRRRQLRAR